MHVISFPPYIGGIWCRGFLRAYRNTVVPYPNHYIQALVQLISGALNTPLTAEFVFWELYLRSFP